MLQLLKLRTALRLLADVRASGPRHIRPTHPKSTQLKSTQNAKEDKPQLRACRSARNVMRFMAWSGRRAGSNRRKETEPGC
jgi:hypothetical protein